MSLRPTITAGLYRLRLSPFIFALAWPTASACSGPARPRHRHRRGTGQADPCPGDATTFWGKVAITGHALFATNCDWSQFDLGWMFTLFFVLLGTSAAIWGGSLERVGPRRAGVVAAFCWSGGFLISALGVYIHQLWLMWLGSGIIGGCGVVLNPRRLEVAPFAWLQSAFRCSGASGLPSKRRWRCSLKPRGNCASCRDWPGLSPHAGSARSKTTQHLGSAAWRIAR